MDILLVSATEAEIAPLKTYLSASWQHQPGDIFTQHQHRLHILITGVGMMQTTYALAKKFQQQRFDFILQAGIAGSYNPSLALAEVVHVITEMTGDLGAEDHYNFLDVFDLGLADGNDFPFTDRKLVSLPHPFSDKFSLPKVSSLSVNSTSGTSFTATARYEKYHCDLENMEGAAFFFVCLKEKMPFAQIRAISNYVTARDKSKWKIKEAVEALNQQLIQLLQTENL